MMALVCSLNPARLCDGCMECFETQDDPQEEYNRRIDAEYDRVREEAK